MADGVEVSTAVNPFCCSTLLCALSAEMRGIAMEFDGLGCKFDGPKPLTFCGRCLRYN